jgi:hypothetical protein
LEVAASTIKLVRYHLLKVSASEADF